MSKALKNTLILTVGLPRSGKSTWAKKQGHPIVNRDAIRLATTGRAFVPEAEALITVIEDYMVKSLFLAGHKTVIVDATHTTAKRRERWENSDLWKVEHKIFVTDVHTCLLRAVYGGRKDLVPIIENMWDKCDVYKIKEAGND